VCSLFFCFVEGWPLHTAQSFTSVTWWKSWLISSWHPVQNSAWLSFRMPSLFLDVGAVSGLGLLCHCYV
jgi:hypothetical protein